MRISDSLDINRRKKNYFNQMSNKVLATEYEIFEEVLI